MIRHFVSSALMGFNGSVLAQEAVRLYEPRWSWHFTITMSGARQSCPLHRPVRASSRGLIRAGISPARANDPTVRGLQRSTAERLQRSRARTCSRR